MDVSEEGRQVQGRMQGKGRPRAHGRILAVWTVHTRERHRALMRGEVLTPATTRVSHGDVLPSGTSQSQGTKTV